MKITPLFDNVLLKKFNQNQNSKIVLPKDLEEKPEIAQVVAVGPGGIVNGEQVQMVVNVGDKVLFNKFASNEFNVFGENYFLIKQTDILAIINE